MKEAYVKWQRNLQTSRVTDQGLKHLGKLRKLRALFLYRTKVTDAGLAQLAALLAHCRDAKATHVCGCWVVDLVLGKE